jgi:RNA polymerase sigma-70 factor (ECF subfamily)
MICVNGIKYQQAAKMLNLPVGTVRSRLSRARERLSEILGEKQDNDLYIPAPEAIQRLAA